MATLNLTSPVFYKNGEPGVSAVVGYESLSNRVVRYCLHTGQSGAGQVALAFSGNWKGSGTLPKLHFYIGTDPDSHADAGASAPYTGTLAANGYDYSGSAEVMLLPDTDYYVWVFPATQVFGWIQWSYVPGAAVADCSGGALTVLTAQPGTLGSPMTLELTRYTEFTHTVTCTLGSQTLTVCEDSTETVLTWTPPLALAEEIPDAAAATAVFSVTSLKDGAAVGTVQRPVTLAVPESVVPTVTAVWQDLSGAFDSFGTCVQLVSRLGVEAEALGAWGSTIRSSTLTLDGQPYTGGVLTAAGEVTLTVTVTDSRGRRGSQSHTLAVAAYAVPWVRIDASRCDADGTPNEMGEFAALTLTGESTQVAEKNRAVLTFAYGETTETAAVSVGSFTERRIIPADSTQTVPLWAELSDAFTTSPRASMVLSIGYATVDFLGGGRGIAFGTTATKEGFTCAMATDFSGHRVTGLPEPAEAADAATKDYVDQRTAQAPAAAMLPDTEYPAGEWWNGRPVYTKLLAFAPSQITAQILSLPHGIGDLEIGLSVEVLWRYVNAAGNVTWRNFPAVYYGNVEWSAQAYFEGPDHIKLELGSQVRAQMAASAENIYVTLRYVKEEV